MATATATNIPETIRLQLRKPKSWHWELSTSKSSPSIILPIVQLYDCKGNLLIETKDTANTTTRKIWHSPDVYSNTSHSRRSRSIRRSGSDTLSFMQKKSTHSINPLNESDRRQSDNSVKSTNRPNALKSSKSSDVIGKIVMKENRCIAEDNESRTNQYDHEGHLSLSKNCERSGVEGRRRHRRSKSDDLFRRKLRYNSSNVESIKRAEIDGYRNFITPNIPHNKNQTEIQAETLDRKQEEKVATGTTAGSKNRKQTRNRIMHTAENKCMDSNFHKTELEEFMHTMRYTTRTSSAGTLIIPDETFKDDSYRRKRNRRRQDGVRKLESLTETQDAGVSVTTSTKNLKDPRMNGFADEKHIRQSSDPTSLLSREKLAKYVPSTSSVKESEFQEKKRQSLEKKRGSSLFHSHSEVFPFKKLLVNGTRHQIPEYDENHNYCEQNFNYPVVKDNYRHKSDNYRDKNGNRNKSCDYPYKTNNEMIYNHCYKSSSNRDLMSNFKSLLGNRENDKSYGSCEIVDITGIDESDRKSRRRLRSRTVDRSRSSSPPRERTRHRKKGHLIKEHAAAQREKQAGGASSSSTVPETGGKDANDLLNLVRRLSYSYTAPRKPTDGDGENDQQVEENDVNMGANVSRHSAKGLGRRSQSSGSICNGGGSGSGGKGSRNPDGKICSSLPSYLDNREKNGACNNNHDRKHHLDEDRIPPLGDSAPLHWKFSDTQTICDQGYGSERSPEEEYPPPLTSLDQEALQCHHHLEPHACYPFITPESTFLVKLTKGSRGLGLSVTGGIDSSGSWPGLIRIKRLFPHQPASSCGLLNVGDLLLEANGITLTGLTNYEALEVLRTAPNHVDLKICRPPPDVLNCVSPISEVPPPPPRREPVNSLSLPSNAYTTPEDEYYHGEFEITLKKIQGSLGFTLRKEDDSALGHYVRALVREPALTDGRIRAGDKIIAVNDIEICPMSHEQAVQFLRQCPDIVKLRLYRDSAQTPVATLSPTETTPRTSFSRKAHLRQEAVDMLNDLAGRKLVGMNPEVYNRSLSPTSSSPRRLRRQPCPSDASHGEYVVQGDYVVQEEYLPQADYLIQSDQPSQSVEYADYQEQFHEGIIQKFPRPFDEDAFNSLFSLESDDGDRPNRPSSLELYNPNQTPVASRKPRFNFSLAHNAYELNNLDAEVLDAPNLKYNLCNEDVKTSDSEVQEPVSMPHISTNPSSNFSHKNPAYQSAHPQITSDHEQSQPSRLVTNKPDDGTLRRRKNTVAAENKEVLKPNVSVQRAPMKEEYEVLAIELNRGWNSRLGFSLQGAAGVTYVSAVHADSVAAKDGRLKPGDRLIKVNDESIEHMTTSEIIDLLRIVRGPVCIVISRIKSNEDCLNSNAEN